MFRNLDRIRLRLQSKGSTLAGCGPSGDAVGMTNATQERDAHVARSAQNAVSGTRERSSDSPIGGARRRDFQPADRWREYLPGASAALVPLLAASSERGAEFPHAERAMFMACEFWAAVTSRRLVQYLGTDGIGTLRYMVIVYLAIGAPVSARAISRAVACVRGCSTPEARQACLINLQLRLVATKEPVDTLLAGLVRTLETGQETESTWVGAEEMHMIGS
jgi:hypothetical protein